MANETKLQQIKPSTDRNALRIAKLKGALGALQMARLELEDDDVPMAWALRQEWALVEGEIREVIDSLEPARVEC